MFPLYGDFHLLVKQLRIFHAAVSSVKKSWTEMLSSPLAKRVELALWERNYIFLRLSLFYVLWNM